MEASHRLLLLLSLLAFFLFFSVSQAYRIPLHQGWSFSTDLSPSSPLPRNAYSVSLFAPILSSVNFSSGKGFSLGFLSLFASPNSSSTTIFFTICLGTNKTDSLGKSFAVPVWNLDSQRPLKQAGKLGFVSLMVNSSNKDLLLKDGDGSVVWRVSNAEAMEMQEDGNLAIYNSMDEVIWQSYDHPSDTLLQGQTLILGKKLVSNNSLFTGEMKAGGILFYMNSEAPAPLVYWLVPINKSVIPNLDISSMNPSSGNLTASIESFTCPLSSKGLIQPYAIFKGQNLTAQGSCSSAQLSLNFDNTFLNSTFHSDFLLLANNGYPQGYTYLHQLGVNYLFSAQSGLSSCLIPNTCGAYGICAEYLLDKQFTCRCPSSQDNLEFINVFNPINPSDPTQGCQRSIPLQCSSKSNSLVEIKNTAFISIHFVYETTFMDHTFPLEECIAHCTANCSCSGFFYHYGTSYCLPFSDTTGLSNLTFISIDNPDFSTYVKVQHSTDTLSTTISHSNHLIKPVVFAIAAAVIVVIIICSILLSIRRYRDYLWWLRDMDMESDEGLQGILPLLPIRYSYKELYKATSGFSKLVGSGGFGCVYEGALPDGRKVAVKKLDQVSPRSKQFLAEVATIGAISHHNIARVFGFCSQKSSRLLVYEFMVNGSLDKWLFCKHKECLLSWTTRFQVALGTARGLAYLHEECARPIIHFDVKPQNILLDKDFVAKLSDFGLCKLVARESSFVMTGVRGTPGYLAPEWLSHSLVSKKCDVYSYGMVLLELVGGRKNAIQSLMGTDEWYFPMWAALKCKQGKMLELVDKRLNGLFDEEQVQRIVHVAFLCIQKDPSSRPSMGSVCKMIEGIIPLGKEPPFTLDHTLEPLFPETQLEPLFPETQASLAASCSTLMEGR